MFCTQHHQAPGAKHVSDQNKEVSRPFGAYNINMNIIWFWQEQTIRLRHARNDAGEEGPQDQRYHPVTQSHLQNRNQKQHGAKSGFEMCFGIGSQHLGCRGSQPKHVRLWFGAGGPNQNTSQFQQKRRLNPPFCLCCFSGLTAFSGAHVRPQAQPHSSRGSRSGAQ